jgi:hypothetical protein
MTLAREDALTVAALRLVPGIEVAEHAGLIWLRGKAADDDLSSRLRAIPAIDRYERLAENRLRRIEDRIPALSLPESNWQRLETWLRVEAPATAFPGTEPSGMALRLVRSAAEHDPELLVTDLYAWTEFARDAAQVRLQCWQFAASAEGLVIIRGKPLAPLAGTRFVLHGNIAVAAGFTWNPRVDPDVLARLFGSSEERLVLWWEDGTFSRLQTEQFVSATRSAIRATAKALMMK